MRYSVRVVPRLFKLCSFCYFYLFCLVGGVHADMLMDPVTELPPITKSGSPGDVLLQDEMVPPLTGTTRPNSGSGHIQNALQNQMAIPMTQYGPVGGAAQVRGFGSSAEDVDIQAFGISLNPPQGGGFDLSIFPQYLWSGYRFQLGPSLSAFNQTASAGTLGLIPWSAEAIQSSGDSRFSVLNGRAIEFYSTLGLNQISAAAQKDRTAVVLGYSSLQVRGPSGSLSQAWGRGSYSGAFHFLMTSLDADTPGPDQARTPRATTQNQRWIPVLQNDFRLGRASLLKTSVFYDGAYVGYRDVDSPESSSDSTIRQGGMESAFLHNAWKFGLSFRQVRYFSEFLQAPVQNIGNLQVSRLFERGRFTFEPTLQGVWVTGFGILPQGSLGARWELDSGQSFFVRTSYSKRIPSLIDRYYVGYSGASGKFVGNPELQLETDWTLTLGTQTIQKSWEGTLQAYVQFRQDTRVSLGPSVVNWGEAYIAALMENVQVHLSPSLSLLQAVTVSHSRLMAAGTEFPYVPGIMTLLGWSIHSSREPRSWDWSTNLRGASSQVYQPSSKTRLAGYLVLDTQLSFAFSSRLSLVGRVENLTNASYALVPGYSLGRSFSIVLTGELG